MEIYDETTGHSLMKHIESYADEYKINFKAFNVEKFFHPTDSLTNYSFLLPFEKELDRGKLVVASKHIWILTTIVAVAYILAIFAMQKLMANFKPFELRGPLIFWNLCMTIFSAVGCFRISHELFRVLLTDGFQHSVCISFLKDQVASFWVAVFCFSKFAQLGDTVFLILRKKKVPFLHWYHHSIVLIYVWHAAKGFTAAGRWFTWMNYFVHSFVYGYLTVTCLNYRPPKWLRMTLTGVEIFQMIIGGYVTYAAYQAKILDMECHQSWNNLYFTLIMYISFFFLFCKYFYENYLNPRHARKGEVAQNGIEKKVM